MDNVRRLGILLPDGCVGFSISTMAGFASIANKELQADRGAPGPIQYDFIGDGQRDHVLSAELMRLQPSVVLPDERYDCIYIPVLEYTPLARLIHVVKSHPRMLPWLREQWRHGATIAAADSAVFLLAETGLLDDRKVAMRPRYARALQERYPALRVDSTMPLTESDRLICAAKGATTFGLPLRLLCKLIGAAGANKVAERVASMLDQDARNHYALFFLGNIDADRLYAKALHWMHGHLRETVRLSDMARDLCVSDRTLMRHFKNASGMTPLAYLRELRLEVAHNLLSSTTMELEDVATAVGYTDYTSFARTFREHFGASPNTARRRGPELDRRQRVTLFE